MTLKTVEQEWEGYAGVIFQGIRPKEVQVKETKQAFFAGAFAMMMAMKEIGDNTDISENDAHAYLTERDEELKAFHRETIRRYTETN